MNVTYCGNCKHRIQTEQYIGHIKVTETSCAKDILDNPQDFDFCSRGDSIVPTATKCSFPGGIAIKPDGIHEIDPCVYEDIELYANATVKIAKCKRCGNIDISWEKQDDTERIF